MCLNPKDPHPWTPTAMISYTIRQMVSPSGYDLNRAEKVLNEAFADEHAFKAIVGRKSFAQLLTANNRAQLLACSLAGEIYVAEDDAGRMIGVALWFGPGRDIYDREQRRLILVFHASEDQRSIALNPFLAQLPHDVRQWTIQSMPRMKAFQEQVFGKGNTRSQWYLQRIGIIPDRQGEGIGTELLDMVRDKAGRRCVLVEATDDETCEFYEAMKFEERGDLDMEAPNGRFKTYAFLWSHSDTNGST
ncbi:uncharacterized protein STEHIDRAFT_116446 [Stereum hirsutum FP-91666 SS1]|uniref:N-acetyltransferase domain-containing protein n=1 Tax=Stereum hirsutum (strain FP-91666) TaxID=721885 RepID=R7RZ09_STEHR|nr:uncharacterized protein STEHIDRAFT_116446 [Stereum hirsutum FP-91666 SS1]EIM79542.1 hypothetical protein STEHIDRAFT_116446 [Stereum hirsutum FP-91666 SS1]